LIVSGHSRPGSIQILDVLLATNGAYADDLGIRCPGSEFGAVPQPQQDIEQANYRPRMAGQSVILQASRRITAICERLLKKNALGIEDVRWLVPHQANANLLAQIARSLHFQEEGGVVSILEDYGNTSSASMGMALDGLRRSGRMCPDDVLLLPAFGAGFTWGAALCRAYS
jgi:3-oxoacyl-[acyl-carrier-protein] synthase-3